MPTHAPSSIGHQEPPPSSRPSSPDQKLHPSFCKHHGSSRIAGNRKASRFVRRSWRLNVAYLIAVSVSHQRHSVHPSQLKPARPLPTPRLLSLSTVKNTFTFLSVVAATCLKRPDETGFDTSSDGDDLKGVVPRRQHHWPRNHAGHLCDSQQCVWRVGREAR